METSGYTLRNYRPSDFDGLVGFFQLESKPTSFTSQRVSEWLSWPHFSPEQDLFIVETETSIVGYMSLRPELEIDRVFITCRLHHNHQRKGLAAKLLECAMHRAHELNASVAHVDVMEDNTIARKALEKHGFSPVRQYYELKLDMAQADWEEAEKTSRGCRHLAPGEEAILADIQNRTFAEHWGYNPNTEETISYIISRSHSSPEDVVLACEEDSIIGFCLTEVIGNGEGRISMIGTDPDFRGKGIGRKILLAGLLYLKSKAVHSTYLTVDTVNEAALILYKSVGFENNNILLTYEKTIR